MRAEQQEAAAAPPQDWYFTFGWGQPNANCYIVFHDTYAGARERMVRAFGTRWSMQYSAAEFAGQAERFGLRRMQ